MDGLTDQGSISMRGETTADEAFGVGGGGGRRVTRRPRKEVGRGVGGSRTSATEGEAVWASGRCTVACTKAVVVLQRLIVMIDVDSDPMGDDYAGTESRAACLVRTAAGQRRSR